MPRDFSELTPEQFDAAIRDAAYRFDVAEDVLRREHAQWISEISRPSGLWDIEIVAERLCPHNPATIIEKGTVLPMKRAAAIQWAWAVRKPASEVLAWFDANTKPNSYNGILEVDMLELGKAFPFDVPKTNGLLNLNALDDSLNHPINRALVYDQLAEVNGCITSGGDDSWFDYIPDAIAIFSHLQAENWADVFTFVLNNFHTWGYPDLNVPNPMEAMDELQDKWDTEKDRLMGEADDMSFQAHVSGLLMSMIPEHDEADPNVYPNP